MIFIVIILLSIDYKIQDGTRSVVDLDGTGSTPVTRDLYTGDTES